MRRRSRARAIVAYEGVRPPCSRLAHNSIRAAPASCAASAEASELAAISSNGAAAVLMRSVRTLRGNQRILSARIAHRIRKTLLDRPCTDFAALVECEKSDLSVLRECGFAFDDARHRFAARRFRRVAVAHQFDDEKAADVADHFFADSGRSRGSNIVVDVKAGADDRAVADAAMEFPRHAARRAGAGEIAVRVDRQHAERVVVTRVAANAFDRSRLVTLDFTIRARLVI